MGREQHPRADPSRQIRGASPRQRQAVEGAGAAADFIDQHQTLRARAAQDMRHLGHLHHESRPSAGQVIRGADAGEDAVHRADARGLGRHEAAGVRQQHDACDLPHISALAAHVRAGDELHAGVVVEANRVGDEGGVQRAFHHRMAAVFDVDDGVVAQRRARQLQVHRARGEVHQQVELRQRIGAILQRGDARRELFQQLVV